MKNVFCLGMMALVFLGVFPITNLEAQTTIRRSYYVNAATGDDANNNGRSEDKPYKTMGKAVEAVKMGVIKTITIIGEIKGRVELKDMGQDEVLITGKPDAAENEKAKISGATSDGSIIKFTYITMEGGGLSVRRSSKVTLGQDVIIQNCENGAFVDYGNSLFLTANAAIMECKNGFFSSSDSASLFMTDDSSITNNDIGVYIVSSATLTMTGNAKVSNNNEGGVKCINNGSLTSSVTMSDNAEISNNSSKEDGGGVTAKKLIMNGGKIINNTAKRKGGGVFAGTVEINGGEIANNQAERGSGIYIRQDRSPSTISGGTIANNKAEYGAGIFIEKGVSFTLKGGNITGNEAEFIGGGIYVQSGATYTATGGTVENNTAGDGTGNDVFNQ